MKRFLIISLPIVSLFLSSSLSAQGAAFGLKVGSNVSGQTEYPSEFQGTPIVRPMAGIYFRLPVSERVQIQPEAILSFQGVNSSLEASNTTGLGTVTIQREATEKLTYINVPIITRVMLKERFAVEFGPQIGYFLGGNSKGNTTATLSGFGVIENEDFDEEITTDDVNEIDISGVAGLSYEMLNGFGINLRVQYGLTGVYKENEELKDYANITNIKNVLAQLGVTYTIPLKK